MTVEETELAGVLIITPQIFGDSRGFFLESYQAERYVEAGMAPMSAQDNLSFSERGVLRGVHLQQEPHAQAKLCQVLQGEVFDIAVDLRRCSPSYRRWVGVRLSAESRQQLYVPPGFGHGFCVLSPHALFSYKCSKPYEPDAEITVRWDDPEIGVEWPIASPTLSARDASAPRLEQIPPDSLPK